MLQMCIISGHHKHKHVKILEASINPRCSYMVVTILLDLLKDSWDIDKGKFSFL